MDAAQLQLVGPLPTPLTASQLLAIVQRLLPPSAGVPAEPPPPPTTSASTVAACDDLVLVIASFADGSTLARMRASAAHWNVLLASPPLWEARLDADFGVRRCGLRHDETPAVSLPRLYGTLVRHRTELYRCEALKQRARAVAAIRLAPAVATGVMRATGLLPPAASYWGS